MFPNKNWTLSQLKSLKIRKKIIKVVALYAKHITVHAVFQK